MRFFSAGQARLRDPVALGALAAITAALVIGALVERVRFAAVMLFSALWLTIGYAPLAHMVWAADGLLFVQSRIDGGTTLAKRILIVPAASS